MGNNKKVIVGVILTETALRTGTQLSVGVAKFTLMKNQIKLFQTDKLCKYAGIRKLEEKINMLKRIWKNLR